MNVNHAPVTEPTQPAQPGTPVPFKRGLALTALIVGIVAFLSGLIPVLGALLGITAIVFGILALQRRQPKGFGLTGLILGAIATVTSIGMTISLFMVADNVMTELENSETGEWSVEFEGESIGDGEVDGQIQAEETFEIGPVGADPEGNELVPWDAFDTRDAPVSTSAGTEEDPHPLGSRIVSDEWKIVINMVNTDAEEQLLALAPENTSAAAEEDRRYTLLHATVNNVTGEPLALGRIDFNYDTPNQKYPPGGYHGAKGVKAQPEPSLADKYNEHQVTGNFSGYVAYKTRDVEGAFIAIRHDSMPDWQYVSLK